MPAAASPCRPSIGIVGGGYPAISGPMYGPGFAPVGSDSRLQAVIGPQAMQQPRREQPGHAHHRRGRSDALMLSTNDLSPVRPMSLQWCNAS